MMTLPAPGPSNEELAKRRRRLNIALGVALAVFVLIFYVLTIVKFGPNVLNREL